MRWLQLSEHATLTSSEGRKKPQKKVMYTAHNNIPGQSYTDVVKTVIQYFTINRR
jgi:hypothetical protein